MPLIAMAGLPGSGKTTLAKTFAQSINSDKYKEVRNKVPVIFNKDTVRNVLFPPDLIDYSSDQDDYCMDIMLRCSQYLFRKNPQHLIILDGRTFTRDYQVQIVKKPLYQWELPYFGLNVFVTL